MNDENRESQVRLAPNQVVELDVESLAVGGRGVARSHGVVIFVDGGLPGSRVRAKIQKSKKRFAEARTMEVLAPSPQAVDAPCPHFGRCGGCNIQDLDYAAQLEWKRRFVADALARVGRVTGDVVEPALASPSPWRYRNKMEFAFGGGRLSDLTLGLKERASDRVVDIKTCLLMSEVGEKALATTRELAAKSGLPAYNPRTGKGLWRHMVYRESLATGKGLVHLIAAEDPSAAKAARKVAQDLAEAMPHLHGVVLSTRASRSVMAMGERIRFKAGEGFLEEKLMGNTFRISPDAFFQVNTAGAEVLYKQVLDLAQPQKDETVWDLYCGSGGLSLALAGRTGMVKGFEIAPSAARDALENAELNRVANCEFTPGDVRWTLGREEVAPDLVVTDPPRSGMHEKVVDRILAAKPSRVVYVSCDPATMARDVARMSERYCLERAVPVDLFPHTAHVECAALLKAI